MEIQNQVKRTLSEPANIALVKQVLAANPELGRTQVADRLCDLLELEDLLGRRQQSSCLKALRKLEQQGHFNLPQGGGKRSAPSPRRLGAAVPAPVGVPAEAGSVRGLELVLVAGAESMAVWNELMILEHPLGAGPLVGRQLRYLVGSVHGWLGAVGFGAAALHLRDRDRWIGWNAAERGAHLDKVVGLARFLIRPSVQCRNLASHTLSLCVKAMRSDFERSYGYAPLLLETFVDTSNFRGTCFRAANWIPVGQTQGRGRQDRDREAAKSVKDIYVYPLAEGFRHTLGLPVDRGLGPLGIADGLDGDQWAGQEFGGAEFGDGRLTRRLVAIAGDKAKNPDRPWTQIAKGDWPAIKAYYRFLDQPDDSLVTMGGILQPHRERTIQRMKAENTVLCVQDGTDLNYSSLEQCKGLDTIGGNQTGAKCKGLHLHSTLAVTTGGLPLGVLRGDCPEPRPKPPRVRGRDGKLRNARSCEIPMEQRKTFAWIEGVRDLNAVARQMPDTRVVSVMDREADLFELFDEWRGSGEVELLVRAKCDRKTTGGEKLFDAVAGTKVKHHFPIRIPRQSARPKRSKQAARSARDSRTANVDLRYAEVEIQPPGYIAQQKRDPIRLWIIHLVERDPPPGTEPLKWFLLTTIPVTDVGTALQCIRWYCLRWRIEDWHRVLKSGCRVEDMKYKTADRIRRAMAINMVVAWRIMLMTLLGREAPELPADVLFSHTEILVLSRYAKKKA